LARPSKVNVSALRSVHAETELDDLHRSLRSFPTARPLTPYMKSTGSRRQAQEFSDKHKR
jgi:hypothetical protein